MSQYKAVFDFLTKSIGVNHSRDDATAMIINNLCRLRVLRHYFSVRAMADDCVMSMYIRVHGFNFVPQAQENCDGSS